MKSRNYFSERNNPERKRNFNLADIRKLVTQTFNELLRKTYLINTIGYRKENGDFKHGPVSDTEAYLLKLTGKRLDFPFYEELANSLSREDIFDIIEILYDIVTKRIDLGFGYHYDKKSAQDYLRIDVNQYLCDFEEGWKLTDYGEIVATQDDFEELLDEQVKLDEKVIVDEQEPTLSEKVEIAKRLFRKRGSTLDDKRHALLEIAAVLEFYRDDIKNTFTRKDEAAIFELLNGYGIRHLKKDQKLDYDAEIFYTWMFYYLLSSLDAYSKLRTRNA